MENNIPWAEVISVILFLITVFFGGWVVKVKKTLNAVKKIAIAIEDNKITKQELKEIVTAIKEIV
jgi:hypothetical protein